MQAMPSDGGCEDLESDCAETITSNPEFCYDNNDTCCASCKKLENPDAGKF